MSRALRGAVVRFGVLASVALTSAVVVPVLPPAAGPAAAAVVARVEDGAAPYERAGRASAVEAARISGQQVEVTDLRSEYTETFANPDGSFVLKSYAAPIRVLRGGAWVPVDPTLQLVGGVVVPKASAVDLRFSAGGSGPMATVGRAGHRLAISWPGSLPAPVLNGNVATYPNVLSGVDLKLTAEVEGYSKVLVVRDAAAALNPALASLTFPVSAPGLTLRAGVAGAFEAVDVGGLPVFGSPGSSMWDSSGPEGGVGCDRPPATELQLRLPIQVGGDSVTIAPDTQMLSSPDTVFPVCIDPPVNAFTHSWTHVNSAAPNTSYWGSLRDSMRVGLEYGTSSSVWRSYVRVDIGSIVNRGYTILAGTFHSRLDHSASCTPTTVDLWHTDFVSPNNPATTWNNSTLAGFWNTWLDGAAANANEAGTSCAVQDDVWMSWGGPPVRGVLQGYANDDFGIITFGLKAAVENDQSKWKRFYPADSTDVHQRSYLEVHYDVPPNAPVAQAFTGAECYKACVSPAQVRTTRPGLRVAVSDPVISSTGSSLRTVFEVRTAASDTATLVASNAAAPVVGSSGSTASWTVPSGALVNNTTYYWRARSTDESNLVGLWSSWQQVKVDTSPPSLDQSSVASVQFPLKKWGAEVGTAGTFTMSGAGDIFDFTWWVDGGSTTTVPATGTTTKTASATHSPPLDMVHTFWVKAKDIAGNVSDNYGHQFWVSPVPARCWVWKHDEIGTDTTAAETGSVECPQAGTTVTAVPATLTASPSFTRAPGHNGNAVYLAGGTATMSQPVVDANKSFTISAWVNPSALQNGDQTMVSQDGTNTSRFQLHYDAQANNGAGGWCFSMRATDQPGTVPLSACATGTVPDDLGTPHPPQDGVWVHLAGVYDAVTGVIQVHVMGNMTSCSGEMVQQTFSGAWTTTGSMIVGRAKSGTSNTEVFAGGIDELRAYPIALSDAEICLLARQ